MSAVARQVHPELTLSHRAARLVADATGHVLLAVAEEARRAEADAGRALLSYGSVSHAVRTLYGDLTQELTKRAYSEMTKAVTRAHAWTQKGPWEMRAGLVVSVLDTHAALAPRVGVPFTTGAVVALAALREYIAAEIIELAGNVCKDEAGERFEGNGDPLVIAPRHVTLAVRRDKELAQWCGGVFAWGGAAGAGGDTAWPPKAKRTGLPAAESFQGAGGPLFGEWCEFPRAEDFTPERLAEVRAWEKQWGDTGEGPPTAAQLAAHRRCVDLRFWGVEGPAEGAGGDAAAPGAALLACEAEGTAHYARELAKGRAFLALATGAPANTDDLATLGAEAGAEEAALWRALVGLHREKEPVDLPALARAFHRHGVVRLDPHPGAPAPVYCTKATVSTEPPEGALTLAAAAAAVARVQAAALGEGLNPVDAVFQHTAEDEAALRERALDYPVQLLDVAQGAFEHYGGGDPDDEDATARVDAQLALPAGTFAAALASWRAVVCNGGVEPGTDDAALAAAFTSADHLLGRLSRRVCMGAEDFAEECRMFGVLSERLRAPFAWLFANDTVEELENTPAEVARGPLEALLRSATAALTSPWEKEGPPEEPLLLPAALIAELAADGTTAALHALHAELRAAPVGPPPLRLAPPLHALLERVARAFAASGEAALVARASAFFHRQAQWRVDQARGLGAALTDVAAAGAAGATGCAELALARVLPAGTAPLAIPHHAFLAAVLAFDEDKRMESAPKLAWAPAAVEALQVAVEDRVVALFAAANAAAERRGRANVQAEDLPEPGKVPIYTLAVAKPALRTLARRAGVLRLGGGEGCVYEKAGLHLGRFLEKLLLSIWLVARREQQKEGLHVHAYHVAVADVVRALKRAGVVLYGYGVW